MNCKYFSDCDNKPRQENGCYTNKCFKTDQSPQPTSEAVSAELALLCCPFCGGEAQYADNGAGDGEWIECKNCRASTLIVFPLLDDVKEKLREAWNKRAI